jgi:hypothetical protein
MSLIRHLANIFLKTFVTTLVLFNIVPMKIVSGLLGPYNEGSYMKFKLYSDKILGSNPLSFNKIKVFTNY